MIRALALCLLATLPATAQDFRGLRPGMPPSDLTSLGEPLAFLPFGEGDPLTEAVYPLPYGQRLQVYFTPERILSLATWGDAVAVTLGDAPATDGLQTFRSTMGDAIDMAGSEGMYFEAIGQFETSGDQRTWWLVYEVPAHPGFLLELKFLEIGVAEDVEIADGLATLPLDAPFSEASLHHPDHMVELVGSYGETLISRPGAAPFETDLTDAFPVTELP